jgi:hypothetical protein
MFGWLLGAFLVILILGGMASLFPLGIWLIRWVDEDIDDVAWRRPIHGLGLASLLGGVLGVLFVLAVLTGDIKASAGHPDGCYYLHTTLVGKTLVQQYEPIVCR